MGFVHLHVHSHYSLLDGLSKIDELVEFAQKEGAPAIALTDHGVMYGAIEFYQKCKKAGIKPLIGVEAYLAPGSRLDKSVQADERAYYHLLLIAKNNIGYKNLLKLTSIGHLEGFYYKPRIDWEVLQKHSEGLIAASACLGGEIPKLISSGKLDRARERILEYNQLFGQGNYYLEMQDHPNLEGQDKVNQQLIKFSRELNIPLIVTGDAHYVNKSDNEAQDILLCLQNKRKKDDVNRMNMMELDASLRTFEDLSRAFPDTPDALENTVKIAEMCDVEIELGQIQLPHFPLPDGMDGNAYLRQLSIDGFLTRYGKPYEEMDQLYKDRLDFELSVIAKMGWPSYLLIVADFVNWAKDNKIVVGPGRGSAAGSLICYLTGITNLCPIQYNLLFERFLNPERISMPDIDMDFADVRRAEVIKYVQDKYGFDHVAQIATFGTMAARAAIRDVGRVLDYPYDFCDKLSKAIPMGMKIKEALEDVEEVREMYANDFNAKRIIDFAQRLEGVARHSSVHACGILITKEPLQESVPVQYASSSDRSLVSQYSLHPIEDLGLLKMDFLGLKNLTIIEAAIKIIKKTQGLEIDIDKIPLDSHKAFELFQKGETTGVFQFESSGMKRYLRELKANTIEDLIAMVALYRPGPMEWIPDYIAGKHGTKKVVYLHPKLENVLSKTYGVAIYQEQVMQMARDLAGFTMGEADVLRRAMGKKIVKLLAEQKDKFIAGCINNGTTKELAEKVFSFIEPFAGYGFNRSHAACYALVAYQTAYLKANWPAEFMAALLTADQQDTDRIAIEIDECRQMGIEVSQPDINQSFGSFAVVKAQNDQSKQTIRFGLKAIKNVGEHIAEVIIEERKAHGDYKDLTDFLGRIEDKDLNKKSLESLIKCGALDNFGERGQLLGNSDNLLTFHKEEVASRNSRQASLFSMAPATNQVHQVRLQAAPAIGRQERLSWEKELLGLYISEHPFTDFKKNLSGLIKPLNSLKSLSSEALVNVSGIISSIKKIMTKKNETMLFVKIEDDTSSAEILVFPKLYKETIVIWQEGKVVLCQGTMSDKDGESKILANKAVLLDLATIETDMNTFKKIQVVAKRSFAKANNYGPKENTSAMPAFNQAAPAKPQAEPLKMIFQQLDLNPEVLAKLRNLFALNSGESKVYFKIINGEQSQIIETAFKVNNTNNLREKIVAELGEKVKIAI